MRCLYCGKQLALLRRWTGGGEFCSEGHKQSYHEEYNKLALSRLLEAQSKPEDYQKAEPEPDNAVTLAGHAKKNPPRDSEQGWTTVQRTDQRRLRAPLAQAALPPAPTSKEAPATAGFLPATALPATAGFLVDKPQLQVPPDAEPPTIIVPPVIAPAELVHPSWFSEPIHGHEVQPPSRAGMIALANRPAFSTEARPAASAVPVYVHESPCTIRTNLTLSTTLISGFALADLLPLEIDPAGPGKPEPELQPAYNFEFQCYFENAPNSVVPPVSPAASESAAPAPDRRLVDLLPLQIRPKPVTNREAGLRFEQISMGIFKPEMPANSPQPLRPRVAAAERVTVSSGAPRHSVKLKPAKPEQDDTHVQNRPTAPQNGSNAETAVAAPEVDVPEFLKKMEASEPAKSVWGSVHKYLKNIVGCLLFATLGGGYFWHLSATKPPDGSSAATELSGESDRIRQDRQIFLYPASMPLQDYRVDFEAPLNKKGTGWVFRVADPHNYYGMRLEPEQDGATLRWKIQKFVEVEGEHILSEIVHLPHLSETGYCRVILEVQGSQFRTYIQGRLVDRWTDARFSRGGFGYSGGANEPFPIRAVRVAALEPSASPKLERHD